MSLLLVRHALTDLSERVLVGRAPGVHLSQEGRRQARELAETLATTPIEAIYASPSTRARETARPLAALRGLPIRPCEGVDEIDYGAWTGRTFAELQLDPRWRAYHDSGRLLPIPGGEAIPAVQLRVIDALHRLSLHHGDGTVAIFTHRDVIRLAVAGLMGIPIEDLDTMEAGYASVTTVDLLPGFPTHLGEPSGPVDPPAQPFAPAPSRTV